MFLDLDDWEQAWGPINHYPRPLARFLTWQEEWGIRHADAITAASRWLEACAHVYQPQTPVLYLPNGITAPVAGAPHWQATNTRDVLFFTRFVEIDPGWLPPFLAALHATVPAARLLVAGEPVQPGLDIPFRTAIAEAGLADRVEWLGFVPRATLSALYARVGCAIFPAADVPLQQAKCSVRLATTLLEGVPVIASAVGEQTNYGAHGAALLVPPDAAPATFAAAVAGVLNAPQQQLALAAQARAQLLERYDWAALAGTLSNFYRQALR
jgi:glycosyltransferase involved in cell wall biosynthesis